MHNSRTVSIGSNPATPVELSRCRQQNFSDDRQNIMFTMLKLPRSLQCSSYLCYAFLKYLTLFSYCYSTWRCVYSLLHDVPCDCALCRHTFIYLLMISYKHVQQRRQTKEITKQPIKRATTIASIILNKFNRPHWKKILPFMHSCTNQATSSHIKP